MTRTIMIKNWREKKTKKTKKTKKKKKEKERRTTKVEMEMQKEMK